MDIQSAENSPFTVVKSTKKGKFAQEIQMGKHLFMADEPTADGGNDLGPSPYDLLLASLGACTSMTIKMYADLKKIPLENVIVKLKHEKKYATDCVNCENSDAKIDHIERQIQLQGALTQEQRDKLLTIANHCPVHRTLTSKIIIKTQLID
ncbi:MAG: OsmC family protein [Candidatus Berkiellales bacterium]